MSSWQLKLTTSPGDQGRSHFCGFRFASLQHEIWTRSFWRSLQPPDSSMTRNFGKVIWGEMLLPLQSFCWYPPRRASSKLPPRLLPDEGTGFSGECADQGPPILSLSWGERKHGNKCYRKNWKCRRDHVFPNHPAGTNTGDPRHHWISTKKMTPPWRGLLNSPRLEKY